MTSMIPETPHVREAKHVSAGKNATLSQVESGKLYGWIDTNRERAATATGRQLADEATAALGFTVTEANASGLRNRMGIKRKYKDPKPRVVPPETGVLARALISVYQHLDMALPIGLVELAREEKQDGKA